LEKWILSFNICGRGGNVLGFNFGRGNMSRGKSPISAARAPQLIDPVAQLGPLKCNNWKNGYFSLTQPHVDRVHSNFTG